LISILARRALHTPIPRAHEPVTDLNDCAATTCNCASGLVLPTAYLAIDWTRMDVARIVPHQITRTRLPIVLRRHRDGAPLNLEATAARMAALASRDPITNLAINGARFDFATLDLNSVTLTRHSAISGFDLWHALMRLLPRTTIRVTIAKLLPAIPLAVPSARDNFTFCFFNILPFTLETSMLDFDCNLASPLSLSGATAFRTDTPPAPDAILTVNWTGLCIASNKLHERRLADHAIVRGGGLDIALLVNGSSSTRCAAFARIVPLG